ncbi:hypothetical protein ACF052_33525 [Streptomyces pilosus]|uniref:hypothetical protein n=1 Tax=Streptomyces pilosus TaxID=28893 RepID=UPI0036FABEC8
MFEAVDAVDALVTSRAPLPSAQERKRLRRAHGLTLDGVAAALKVRRPTVSGESVKKTVEPRGPEREAYARVLNKLGELYPEPPPVPEGTVAPAVPDTFTAAPAPTEAQTPLPSLAPDMATTTATENAQIHPGHAYGGDGAGPGRAGPVTEPDRGEAVGTRLLGAGGDVGISDRRELGFQRRPPDPGGAGGYRTSPAFHSRVGRKP